LPILFFANVAGEIEDLANAKGYRIFYCSSKNDLGKTKELITAFEERQVDGYIITPVEGIEQKIKMLTRGKKKLVLFDRYFPNIDTNYVVLDNEAGAYQATNHLLDNNYTKIAFVTTDSEQTQMLGRLKGYKKAMQARGLKPLIKKVQYNERSGPMIDELIKFLQNNRRIEAVFFATNYLGVYGLEAIHQLALAIPSQLAVVSFDDHDLFRLHKPSITVVAQPIQKISTSLIQVLLDAIDDKTNTERQQIVISPELIIRQSTTLRH
jgi:LacI family transcriptional regulator